MGGDAAVPKPSPAKKDNETPESIKDGDEEEADCLAAIDEGAKHFHHFPGPVKIDHTQKEPES